MTLNETTTTKALECIDSVLKSRELTREAFELLRAENANTEAWYEDTIAALEHRMDLMHEVLEAARHVIRVPTPPGKRHLELVQALYDDNGAA